MDCNSYILTNKNPTADRFSLLKNSNVVCLCCRTWVLVSIKNLWQFSTNDWTFVINLIVLHMALFPIALCLPGENQYCFLDRKTDKIRHHL